MAPQPEAPGGGGRRAALALALVPANKRRAAAAAAALAAAGYAWAQHRAALARADERRRRRRADGGGAAAGAAAAAAKAAAPRRPASGAALRQLLPLLLRIGGRKVAVIVALALARTALSNRLARLQGYLFRAAFLRRVPLFARNLAENVALCALASGLEATSRAWVSRLELQWRRALTERLHADYFAGMTYYKLSHVDRRGVDAPEARLCDDVPKLAAGLAALAREVAAAGVDAAFYAAALRRYSGTHKYTGMIVAYVFGVGAFMAVGAPSFGGLYKRQAALEGGYRALHSRLRANAEAVAFLGGAEREGALLRARFADAAAHHGRLLGRVWRFSMVQDFLLKYLGATVAVALIVGPFFSGHMRPEATVAGRAQMLAAMRYHTSVVISLFGALGALGGVSRKLQRLGAHADRVAEMGDAAAAIRAAGEAEGASSAEGGAAAVGACEDAVVFDRATVVTPAGAVLVRDLSLRVPAGTNLLVTGPNGAGKSSLFRVLGGLWPLAGGRLAKPGGAGGGLSRDIFYVPQRPYVGVGTLQEQLLYPLPATPASRIPPARLRALLATVDLEALADADAGGDAEAVVDWGERLSLGEQQRLGMARLFFHRPRFAILDECTSGVSTDMEERFCRAVKDMGCTCVTISHRPALMAFHDVVLSLDGEGGWSLHRGARLAAGGGAGAVAGAAGAAAAAAGGGGGKGGKKVRSADAAAVLAGMTSAVEAAAAGGDLADDDEGYVESVVARAPASPATPAGELAGWEPGRALRARASRPAAARWRAVLAILAGGDAAAARRSAASVAAVAGVVVLRTLLQDRIASLNGRSVDLVLRQDLPGFVRLIGVSVAQSAASAVLAPSLRHVADVLALRWRRRLTAAALERYTAHRAFYAAPELAGMRDADARLSRDVERLTADLADLIPSMVKPVVDVAWFSWRLWALTGRRGAAVLYLYTAAGYAALRAATPDFGGLARREAALEGALRAAHSRLVKHAESVAFFGGGGREGAVIGRAFDAALAHGERLVAARWHYAAADEFFSKQLPHNVTWLLTLLYALDQRGDFGDTRFQGALVQQIRYLASVVTQCFVAFGELLALPKRLGEIGGGVARVSEALEVLDAARRLGARQDAAAAAAARGAGGAPDAIEFLGVDVVAPTGGRVLARALTAAAPRGRSLLVTGPNGAGKTSVARVLAGLWPSPPGGALRRPAGVLTVPQRPYATPGSLREQVCYPLAPAAARAALRAAGAADPWAALDAAAAEALAAVRLGYLVDREGGWDAARDDWDAVLSLGEQQRLGMARLFFHRPAFAVLDEATNATSVDVEQALYERAAALGITLVTITQRTALVRHHAAELRLLDGAGGWELRAIRAQKGKGEEAAAA